MKVNVAITISRPSSGDGRKVIALRLQDRASNIQFVDVEFPIADFMEALTGLSHVDGEGEVRGLEHVGKVRESEDAVFAIPKAEWDAVTAGEYGSRHERGNAYIRAVHARDGWFIGTNLGSQNAQSTDGDIVKVRGYYFRYVKQ